MMFKNGEYAKYYTIKRAFSGSGFRIFFYDYINDNEGVIVDKDGKSDRIFETDKDAL